MDCSDVEFIDLACDSEEQKEVIKLLNTLLKNK